MMQFLSRAHQAPSAAAAIASNVRFHSTLIGRAAHQRLAAPLAALPSYAAAASSSSSSSLHTPSPLFQLSTRSITKKQPAAPRRSEAVEEEEGEELAEGEEDLTDEFYGGEDGEGIDIDASGDAEDMDLSGLEGEITDPKQRIEYVRLMLERVRSFEAMTDAERSAVSKDEMRELEQFTAKINDEAELDAQGALPKSGGRAKKAKEAAIEAEEEENENGEEEQSGREDRRAGRGDRRSRNQDEGEEAEDETAEELADPIPLRPEGRRLRGPGEDFPGFVVSIVSSKSSLLRYLEREELLENDMDSDTFEEEMKESGEFEKEDIEQERLESDVDSHVDPISEYADNPETYAEANDPNDGWRTKLSHEPDETLVEVIHYFNPMTNRTESYRVGGDDAPPPFWPPPNKTYHREQGLSDDYHPSELRKIEAPPGRIWLTWQRSWEDLRKNGIEPSDAEITDYLTEILGIPKLKHPILPELVHTREETFPEITSEQFEPRPADPLLDVIEDEADEYDEENAAGTIAQEARRQMDLHDDAVRKSSQIQLQRDAKFEDTFEPGTSQPFLPARPVKYLNLETDPLQILKTEAGWQEYIHRSGQPKTWFEEARRQYRQKVHLVRVKYLGEYRRVKALHDANIQARWDEHQSIKRENLAIKAERLKANAKKQERIYDLFAARRARIRNKSRITRLNKEMKARRHAIHMFNYILKEREYNWIQARLDPSTKQFVQSTNLTTKLFEKQESVVGFWPKPSEQDLAERKEEEQRRRMIKEQA